MSRRAALVACAGVFLVVFAVHARSAVVEPTDSLWTLHTATSLIEHGDLDLDEYHDLIERDNRYAIKHVNGHDYEYFPSGTAVLTAPILAVGRLVGLEPSLAEGPDESAQRTIASMFVAAAAAVLCGLGIRTTQRLQPGLVLAAVFAFATSAWSVASRALWQHGPSMFLLALVLFLATSDDEQAARFVGIGALLTLAYFVRPTNAISALAFVVWVLWRRRQNVVHLVLGAAATGIPYLLLNLRSYGSLLPPYFSADRLELGSSVLEAAAANLVSPGRGLLIYSPVLVFAVVGVIRKVRDGTLTALDRLIIATIVTHFLVICAFPHWWGGWAYGPRFWLDMLPYLCWFLLPVIAALDVRPERASAGKALQLGFAVTLLWSLFVNAKGATNQRTFDWNQDPVSVDVDPSRIWDWSDPPFLRG